MSNYTIAEMCGIDEASVRRWRKKNGVEPPKILIWDIESAPILGYTWGLWDQNVIEVVRDWSLLTVSWTWYGSGVYNAKQLCDFKEYRAGDLDDKSLTLFAKNLLDECDYAVAHNGNAFDIKKINAKIAEHGYAPPSPYTAIDTLMIARRKMKMSSNKLDSLGQTLGLGRKLKHSGFDLWLGCMAGKRVAWKEMGEYAKQDVRLLEQIFERLLPWTTGLNFQQFGLGTACTNCGSGSKFRHGHEYFKTALTKTPAWQCIDCGTWNKEVKIKTNDKTSQ